MSNKKQTAVEWLSNKSYELFEQYSEGKFDRITLNKLMLEATFQAEEMEKEQIINACNQTEFEEEDNLGIAENLTKGEQYYKEIYEQ